jgi:8-oxo-dGTP pyrophosphatase MutT (NUDIX family)
VTTPLGADSDVPDWLDDVRRGANAITTDELTRWHPPQGETPRRGAVLMLFGEGPRGPDLVLTERAHHMRSHPGQVSFPGGSIDSGETPRQAALREAWEEIGVDPSVVSVIGELPELWLPPSNFSVTTVLGWSRAPHRWVVSPDEVHAIWRTPIAELLDPANRIGIRHPSGWVGPGFLIGADRDVVLWGFTAGIIDRFFSRLGWSRPWNEKRVQDLPGHMVRSEPRQPAPVLPEPLRSGPMLRTDSPSDNDDSRAEEPS